jgi:hypothetical protein
MNSFTELPFQQPTVLPSQQGLQQQLAQQSAMLRQNRMYMQQEADNRQKEMLAYSSFQIDPSITETVQRQKMMDDVQEYIDFASKLYASADSGYLRLSPKQQLELQNKRNELVGKQSQRMAAQASYNAAYKEMFDPKNAGLYKRDFFEERAKAFKNGEIVSEFLEPYGIQTDKALADRFKLVYTPNGVFEEVKNIGKGYNATFKTHYSTALFGDTAPTAEQAKAKVGDLVYEIMTNPDDKDNYAILQDFNQAIKQDPELAKKAQVGDEQAIKEWAANKYGQLSQYFYKQDAYRGDKPSRTTVNNYFGNGKPVTIKYNKAIDGYLFSGTGKDGKPSPIPVQMDITPSYYTKNSKGELVQGKSGEEAETFRDAQITGIIKYKGELYAAVTKNLMTQQEGATNIFTGDKAGTKEVKSQEKKQTLYVPYEEVQSIVEQNGYNLEDWEKFSKGYVPVKERPWTQPDYTPSPVLDTNPSLIPKW